MSFTEAEQIKYWTECLEIYEQRLKEKPDCPLARTWKEDIKNFKDKLRELGVKCQ